MRRQRRVRIWVRGIMVFFAGGLFLGSSVWAEESGQCPQPRFTGKAPDAVYNLKNPLEPNPENLSAGEVLFQNRAKPMPCKMCHGVKGDGQGPMSKGFDPPPRNFTCAQTINGVPDGQLFWIIQNGSPGTGMLAFKSLKDDQVWQVVLFIRKLVQP
ncbi:MAG: cytochrome C [Nitrospinae bacterium CG11_big_fil_rev_8_21_14_0_20_56_8]|nr:MAG: cytochrome C [Nitrospinae bacterium CG11_big_fil_rev_8_21_14_0_20_56_8]